MSPDDPPRIDQPPPVPDHSAPAQGPSGPVRLSGRYLAFEGYAQGFRQPVAQYTVDIEAADPSRLAALDLLMGSLRPAVLERPAPAPGEPPVNGIVQRLMDWTTALLRQATHPVFEPARVLEQHGGPALSVTVAQPCLNHWAALQVLHSLIELINRALDESVLPDRLATAVADSQAVLAPHLQATGLQGFDPLNLLSAAAELDVPWRQLQGSLFQLGQGANARWIDSTWTDRTATIATRLARDKQSTADLLRLHGLPAPPHRLADSAEQAVRHAQALGYPVVVKPADQDGGNGVKAGLHQAEAVRRAFDEARALSKWVLVEKHVPGKDYRVVVVEGQVLGVLERVPGGVVGNGRDTVEVLLQQQNHDRRTAVDDRRFLHPMAFDDEAVRLLASQGLQGNSVPAQGQGVRLRSASNVASGGVPVPVPLDRVDADNLRLAVHAARALRLDVAGIDLLIPDIGRSWLQTGAYICEVNSRPQVFSTQHKPMLVRLLKGGSGRIPIVVVVESARAAHDVALRVHQQLLARGVVAGLARGRHTVIGRDVACPASPDTLAGAKMLLLDASVQALVIALSDDDTLSGGWPIDRCDVLVLGPGAAGGGPAAARQDWVAQTRYLRPATVLVDAGQPDLVHRAQATFAGTGEVRALPCGTPAQRRELADGALAALGPGIR